MEWFLPYKKINKLIVIETDQKTLDNARIIAKKKGIPVHDAVHALLAKSSNAILVTRDAHFSVFSDIQVKKPEEL